MKHVVSNAAFFRQHAVGALRAEPAPGPARAGPSGTNPGANSAQFTPRQLEVLALLCEGLPNKLICRRLNIASGTVKVHISCILKGLGVTSRLQAVVAARSLGIGAPGATTIQPAVGGTLAEQFDARAHCAEERTSLQTVTAV